MIGQRFRPMSSKQFKASFATNSITSKAKKWWARITKRLDQHFPIIGGSEPMQNDQTYFFSDIFLKFYNIVKIII
jgi:hypothetical protein